MSTTKKYVSLDKLSLYDEKIKKVISDGDAAALKSAKDYSDSLAVNYEAAGTGVTVLAEAKSYADGKDAAIQAAQTAGDNAQAAAEAADAKAVAAQNEVDALETYVGTIPETSEATNIVAYVQEKTAGIATDTALEELTGRVSQAETDIDNIEKDYLKAADKTELQGNIDTVSAAVATEKSRAEGVESGLDTRVKTIEDDYLKAADKTELQGNIDTVSAAVERLTNGVSADEIDGVNDLITYVNEHGTEVTGMKEDISENASAIEGVAGRVTTAEGKITTIEGAVSTKAEKTYVDEQIEALEGVDTGLDNRLKAVEAQLGDGENSVSDLIATAKQEAIDAAASAADTKDAAILAEAKKYADDEDAKIESRVDALETASATHALASDVTTLAGRVTTVEGKVSTLESEMDAVEALAAANKSAHEANAAAIALKASQADLEAVSGRVTTLETWHNNFTEVSEEEINALFA